MKNLIILALLIILSSACRAQLPLAKISSSKVKANDNTYSISKPDNKVTEVINLNNKLTNSKMAVPNLPSGIMMPDFMRYDKNLLVKICADIIPITTLKKLPNGFGDWIFIAFKVDVNGNVLEMEFVLKNNSLITGNEIQKIEESILKSSFKVSFIKGIERYFEGANYINLYTQLRYSDMLKVKQGL